MKREQAAMLIFPAEAADPGLSGSFEDRNLNGLALNHASAGTRLIARNIQQRLVVDRFGEAISQSVEGGSAMPLSEL
jgi:hypothetical protein